MYSRPLLYTLSLLGAASLVVGQPARTFTFDNQCSSDVWILATTNADGSCANGAPCPAGTACDEINDLCFYVTPKPNTGNWRVTQGGTSVITLPFVEGVNLDTLWGGNFQFCQDGTTCQQSAATCDQNGCGSTGPFGLAEFTLLEHGPDGYDISLENGVTVPFSITPQVVDSTNTESYYAYACGSPGSPAPSTGIGAVSWNMVPPSNVYQWVTPPSLSSPLTCTSNSNCPSGQVCGVINNNNAFEEVCGYISGYWSYNAACVQSIPDPTPLFPCTQTIQNGPYTTTMAGFQGCAGTNQTCYNSGAGPYCCGCVNWNSLLGTDYVPLTGTTQCAQGANNTLWISDILPTIEWTKKGCPSCYSYPYDDPSSSFSCEKTYEGVNIQNYTITLCPSGVDWPGVPGGGSTTTTATATATATATTTHTTTTTTTTAGAGPTPGTCSGTPYSPSTQVCDNGHVVSSGQYYCAGGPYSPATYCCSSGALVATSNQCTCSGVLYDGGSDVCDNNQLCARGDYSCGTACYAPASYGCCNGALTPAGQGC